jgi:transposase-like protein
MKKKDLANLISSLSRLELEELRTMIDQKLNPHIPYSISQLIDEQRFSAGAQCPHCHKTHIRRNGTRNGKQRYICVDCGKTFGSTTGSILSGTKKDISVWVKYCECMANKLSLRKSAEICDIDLQTAFFWRHKILQALNADDQKQLSGIVESDETYFPDNFKGNCNAAANLKKPKQEHRGADDDNDTPKSPAYKKHRESGHKHSRGKATSTRGLSRQKVCVPCAIDRTGKVHGMAAGRGKVSADFLHMAYDDHIIEGAVLVTDKDFSDRKFARENHLEIIQLKNKTESRKGLYNLQRANNLHGQLKNLVGNFKNVSTKHLNNYVVWLGWNVENKGMTVRATAESILRSAGAAFYRTRCADIRFKPALPFETGLGSNFQHTFPT